MPFFAERSFLYGVATRISTETSTHSNDVLSITSYDDSALTGTFAVEADRTFTYPIIGRVQAGGLTLRQLEASLEEQLTEQGFFRAPEITVAVEQYRSQRVFILGEVRKPGAYTLSGDMRLVEALALAGSTLSTASGEAVVVPASADEAGGGGG